MVRGACKRIARLAGHSGHAWLTPPAMIKLRNARVRTNSAPHCPNAELPAVVVHYESRPGFVGTDSFILEVKGEVGAPSRHKFSITVAGMIQ